MIKVLVGSKKHPFIVHRHVLVKVPFFAACLHSKCKESHTGVVELTIGPARAFGYILNYLHRGGLILIERDKTLKGSADTEALQTTLSKMYRMAHFLMMERLTNTIIDTLFAVTTHSTKIHPPCLVYLASHGLHDTKLMHLFLMLHVRHLLHFATPKSSEEFVDECFDFSTDLAKMYTHAMLDRRSHMPHSKWKVCDWHAHDSTPVCKESNHKK